MSPELWANQYQLISARSISTGDVADVADEEAEAAEEAADVLDKLDE